MITIGQVIELARKCAATGNANGVDSVALDMTKTWDEAKHPRIPKGAPNGGQFMHMPDLLASLKAHGGFTYDPHAGREVPVGSRDGYAIAIPGTEHVIGGGDMSRDQYKRKLRELLDAEHDKLKPGIMVGGYYSEDRGVYLVELSQIHDIPREQAIAKGSANNQESILDMRTGELIDTGGTGDWSSQLPALGLSVSVGDLVTQLSRAGVIELSGQTGRPAA